jgi:hypothetical protein
MAFIRRLAIGLMIMDFLNTKITIHSSRYTPVMIRKPRNILFKALPISMASDMLRNMRKNNPKIPSRLYTTTFGVMVAIFSNAVSL